MTNPTNSEDVRAAVELAAYMVSCDNAPNEKARRQMADALDDGAKTILALVAALDEAREALKPFAKAASASAGMVGRQGDSYELIQNGGPITFMDLRRAAKTINPAKEG